MNTPQMRLSKALFTINFLNNSFDEPLPPVVRHFSNDKWAKLKVQPLVLVRDPESLLIQGPFPLVTWGRGYTCVSTPAGPKWIPSKWVKPYTPKDEGKWVNSSTSKIKVRQAHFATKKIKPDWTVLWLIGWKNKKRKPKNQVLVPPVSYTTELIAFDFPTDHPTEGFHQSFPDPTLFNECN